MPLLEKVVSKERVDESLTVLKGHAGRALSVGALAARVALVVAVATTALVGAVAITASTSMAGAAATSTGLRYLLLRGAPQGAVVPITFDFSSWAADGTMRASIVAADGARHCSAFDASHLPTDEGASSSSSSSWETCEGHFSPLLFSGGPGAFTVALLLDLPDDMVAAGMLTATGTFLGRSDEQQAVDYTVARGTGSAAVHKQSSWLHNIRSLMFLPLRLAGLEVNTQLVEIPLVSGFAPPVDVANSIKRLNVTVTASMPYPQAQVYGARVAMDVELRGWSTYYLQRYPVLSAGVMTALFFTIYFATSLTVVVALAAAGIVAVDAGSLIVAFIQWKEDGDAAAQRGGTILTNHRQPIESAGRSSADDDRRTTSTNRPRQPSSSDSSTLPPPPASSVAGVTAKRAGSATSLSSPSATTGGGTRLAFETSSSFRRDRRLESEPSSRAVGSVAAETATKSVSGDGGPPRPSLALRTELARQVAEAGPPTGGREKEGAHPHDANSNHGSRNHRVHDDDADQASASLPPRPAAAASLDTPPLRRRESAPQPEAQPTSNDAPVVRDGTDGDGVADATESRPRAPRQQGSSKKTTVPAPANAESGAAADKAPKEAGSKRKSKPSASGEPDEAPPAAKEDAGGTAAARADAATGASSGQAAASSGARRRRVKKGS